MGPWKVAATKRRRSIGDSLVERSESQNDWEIFIAVRMQPQA